MAYQKLQAGAALAVIKSDDVDIPNPASLMVSSTTTSATASQLNDTNQNFNTLGVKPGDIIYDSSNTVASKVNFVVSDNELNVTPAIASGANYKLYAQSSLPSNGCVLYIGSGGDVSITTVSGDTVLFKGLVTGQFVPVQTIRVNSTGTAAADIVALW
jgi:hypothetical protein|tara:strand:+ start:4450 stop:4923 length:474 start_codon:yes stop_codon:yes gene_type:complete